MFATTDLKSFRYMFIVIILLHVPYVKMHKIY